MVQAQVTNPLLYRGEYTQLFAFGSGTWVSPPHSVLLKDTSRACHFSLPGPRLSNYLILQYPKLRIPKERTLPLPPALTPHCGALKTSKDLLDARNVQALEITERLLSYPVFSRPGHFLP